MKTYRLIAAAFIVAALTSINVAAQQRPNAGAQQRPVAATPIAASNAAVPDSKIAFVNTEQFGDEKAGISRYVAAVSGLQREFQPRQTELQNLNNQLKQIADDISKLSAAGSNSVVDPKTVQQKQDQGEALQRQIEFKKKEADAAFQKRYQEVVGPISDDIGKALDGFAKQRGITMLFDISKLAPTILTADPAMDLTVAFIADYNSRNPARAAAAAPGR